MGLLFKSDFHDEFGTWPLRPGWETVVNAVIDVAVTLLFVDATRIAISDWSLGGYLSPRAASGDERIAACIADPGQPSVADGLWRATINLMGASPEAVADLGKMDQTLLDRMEYAVTHTPGSSL